MHKVSDRRRGSVLMGRHCEGTAAATQSVETGELSGLYCCASFFEEVWGCGVWLSEELVWRWQKWVRFRLPSSTCWLNRIRSNTSLWWSDSGKMMETTSLSGMLQVPLEDVQLWEDKLIFYLASLMLVTSVSSDIDSYICANYITNRQQLGGRISWLAISGPKMLTDLYIPRSCHLVIVKNCYLLALRTFLVAIPPAEVGQKSSIVRLVLSCFPVL